MNHEIESRIYGLSELGLLYNPSVCPTSAARILNRWIDRSPGLRHKLNELGFKQGMRTLTPLMVRTIVEALGEP